MRFLLPSKKDPHGGLFLYFFANNFVATYSRILLSVPKSLPPRGRGTAAGGGRSQREINCDFGGKNIPALMDLPLD
jgi:hypothetical protein